LSTKGASSEADASAGARHDALAAASAGRVDDACRICLGVIDGGSAEAWPHELLAWLLPQKSDTRAAAEVLERAVQRGSPPAAALHALGTLYYRLGAFGKADAVLQRAAEADPYRGDVHYLRGLVQFHAGRGREAVGSFRQAARLDPANNAARYQLAVALARLGRHREAIEQLRALLQGGVDDAAAHYRLGLAHRALGEMADAAYHFARSLEIDPCDEASRRMLLMMGRRPSGLRRGPAAWLPWLGAFVRTSLVARVALVAAAVFVLAGGGLATWLVRSAEDADVAAFRARAWAVSDALMLTLRTEADAGGTERLRSDVAALAREGGFTLIRVMSKSGLILASSQPVETGTSMPRTDATCAGCHDGSRLREGSWGRFRVVQENRGPGLELLRPLGASAGGTLPAGMLHLVLPLDEVEQRRHGRRLEALAIGTGAVVLVALAVALIVRVLVRRPLAALEAAAGRVAAGELTTELPDPGTDEVGRLVTAFNWMTRELRRGADEVEEAHRDLEQRVEDATTQYRSASEELKAANERLLEFDRLKSAYVQKVVHDLRAPLAAVLISLQNADEGLLGPLDTRAKETIARALARAHAMDRLIADLLDLERLRTEAARPVRVALDAGEVFAKAAEAARERAERRRVALETEGLGAAMPLAGDPEGLASVAANLVDNAVKYTRAGGLVRVTAATQGSEAVLKVSDSGIGIPAAELPLVFGEFFRASNARAVEHEGTGLGLAIVRRIVEAHGGSIAVESVLGSGTTFTVRLPLQAQEVRAQGAA